MARQPTEVENDGMTAWFDEEYGSDGFKASRVSDNRTRLRLPKQADNIGELITRAYEEHGAICDLSLDSSGRPEFTFWCVPRDEDGAPPPQIGSWPGVKLVGIVAAVILFLVAVVEIFVPPLELGV